jgi:dsDNA-specific endonuclease/ATPase MutS2
VQDLIDNQEVNEVMEILENMEDEALAVELLKQFNEKTKKLGQLITNRYTTLDHANWKVECDDAKKEVDDLIKKIKSHK